MKYLKMLGLTAVAAMALTAFTGGSASATTLEVGGVAKSSSVSITASLASGSSMITRTTGGLFFNTCTESHAAGATVSPFSNKDLYAPLSALSFKKCSEGEPTVDAAGGLTIEWIKDTEGTMYSSEEVVTSPSPFGTLNCKTGTHTHTGTFTGVKEGHATLHINSVVNCGIVPSALWVGTYTVTSPTGLGVVA